MSKGWFSFRDWSYGTHLLKEVGAVIASIGYMLLVIAFIHLDVISTCIHDKIVDFSLITNEIVCKHSQILSLLANWGILLLLCVDIIIAHKNNSRQGCTLLTIIIGGSASLVIYWCAIGCTEETISTEGCLAYPKGCLIALIVFILASQILKYITIKPQDKK